jgi:hypothetical protein
LTIEEEELRVALTELVAYFGAAAEGNLQEARGYGPFRLLEGAVRTIRLMDQFGYADRELTAWGEAVTRDAILLSSDRAHARRTAERLLAHLSKRLASDIRPVGRGASAPRDGQRP